MSIRTRLFLSVSFLIVFFVALSFFLNSEYLGKYYIAQKRATLVESKDLIEGLYKGDPEAISLELDNLERNKGLNISFLSSDFEVKYNSSIRTFRPLFEHRPPDGPPLKETAGYDIQTMEKGHYAIIINRDPRLKTDFLVLVSRLNNNDILMLSSPLAAINESTAIANRFFLFTGLITIFLGGGAIFWYAKRFTKPILELNDIAQRMSKLDFSKKYPIQSQDEIGQLGGSINSLSYQLDKAISELTEANDKLKEDIEQERRLDKMRKEFVSNVSHELKTPIALIQGYAEGLKLNVNEDEENRNYYCDVIMDEADKMNRLVRDLLDLSQIESGSFRLEKTAFDISLVTENVLEKYKPMFGEKGINVQLEKPERAAVYADYRRIEQVLVNYLTNAINHADEQRQIKIQIGQRNDKVRVSVYNSGKNIPEESLDKLWTSFYKVDKARTRAYGGTGLGLSVVKSIMELHHNRFGVENQSDGVLFWFEVDKDRQV